mmetsp:Transcript_56338/g.132059  ORF Transcript_56338/g.132059 Transcript_56338/m.132059 type:complete len:680 (-) Transcript_56338:40-2079(-)
MSSDELTKKLARRRTGEIVFQSTCQPSVADADSFSPPASPRGESSLSTMAEGERFAKEVGEELGAKLTKRRLSGETVFEKAGAMEEKAEKRTEAEEDHRDAPKMVHMASTRLSTSCTGELALKLAKRRFGEEIFSFQDDIGEKPQREEVKSVKEPVVSAKEELRSPSNAAEEVEKRKNTELQKLLLAGTKAHQDDKWDTAEEYYTKVLEAVGLQISAAEPLGLDGIPTNANVAEALHLLGALRIQRQVAAGDAADSDDEDHHAAQRSPTRRHHDHQSPEAVAAVSLLRAAIAALPGNETPERKARPLTSLGTGLVRLGDETSLREAVEMLREACKLAPQRWSAHMNLARALGLLQNLLDRKGHDDEAEGLPDERVAALRAANKTKPGHARVLLRLGLALKDRGYPQEAIQVLSEYIELASKNGTDKAGKWRTATAVHWLAVLRGESTATAPAEYVAGLFDAYADKFDTHLVQQLGYSTPQLLTDEIRHDMAKCKGGRFERCADLGCGTGLMAPLLKDIGVERLEGVDLSEGMLKKAEEKGGYDRLVCGDLLEIFKPPGTEPVPGPFDLIVAADVFVYLGDLKPVFAAIAQNLRRPSGLVAVSTEAPPRTGGANEGSTAVPACGYGLAETGRYMHTAAYVRSTAEDAGLSLTTRRSVVLRFNGGKPVHGHLHLLRHAVSS